MADLLTLPIRYVACDPDTKSSAYAVIDASGKLVDAWVVKSKGLEDCALQHALHLPEVETDVEYLTFVESQQFYNAKKIDDLKKVKTLLVLARACGINMMYTSMHFGKPELILPRHWSKSRNKKATSYWTLSKMGYTVKEAAGYCYAEELLSLFPKTQQKHLVDAISIAQYAREQHQTKTAMENSKGK